MKKILASIFATTSLLSAPVVLAQSTSLPAAPKEGVLSDLSMQAQSGKFKDLSLAEAVRLALENAPDLQVAAAQAAGAQARYEQVKDSKRPTLAVGVSSNLYTNKQTICFADEAAAPPANACESDGGVVPDLTTRGFVTYGAQANVSYPITAQFTSIKNREEASRYEIDGIEISREVSKREIVWQAEQSYIQLLKVMKAKEAASEGVKLAQAQVDRVKKFYDVGALAKNDLLRAELSLAQAQQVEISAQTGVLLAEGMLVTMLGFSADTHLVPTETYSETAPAVSVSLEGAIKAALEKRPEIDQIESQIGMTIAMKEASKSVLYPQVGVTASAQYSGGSAFQEGFDVFATVSANWVILDWGVAKQQVTAAEATVSQIKASQEKLTQGIILDVRSRYFAALSAKASLDLSEKSIESAEENQRITTARFDAKTATTTDLLDAQVLLTRAKISVVTARYDYYIALAGLKKSMGEAVTDRYFAQAKATVATP
jgi:outer membrane protein